MNIKSLDHLVLTVQNIAASCEFYQAVMGMEKIVFGEGRVALKFGLQKINLHEYGNEFEPKANSSVPGSADLCFISDTPIEDVMNQLQAHGVEVIAGPVQRTGACHPIMSVYFRDPDGNLIEISNEII
ncbi:MAG: VOC family protein [Gammaproteobacteria bacterium]|nr:VOC family protein [Gammaproteobacteria bacterium]